MRHWTLALVLLLLASGALGEAAEPGESAESAEPAESTEEAQRSGKGDTLTPLALEDQHGELRKLDAAARHAVFTREMDAGDVLKEALDKDGATLLEQSGTVYIADVSRMPGLVRRLFALPSMRRRPYPMLLDIEGDATASFPSEEGKVTLLTLDALQITRVEYLDSAEAIRAALAR